MTELLNELKSILEPGIPHCSNDTCQGCGTSLPYSWLSINRKALPFTLRRVDIYLEKTRKEVKNTRRLITYKVNRPVLCLSRERGETLQISPARYLAKGFCSRNCWETGRKTLDRCSTCRTAITPRILTVGIFVNRQCSPTVREYCPSTREYGPEMHTAFCSQKCCREFSGDTVQIVKRLSTKPSRILLRDDDGTREYNLDGWDTD